MRLHVTGRRLIRQPDVISHLNAVEEVVAAPKQTWNYHSPSAICDDLSSAYALVPNLLGKFVATCGREKRAHSRLLGWLWLRLWLDDWCRVIWHVPRRRWESRLVCGRDRFA